MERNFYKSLSVLFITVLTINVCPVSYAISCYKCNSLPGFKDYDPHCFEDPKGNAPMETGAAACLSSFVRYMGKSVAVRFGLYPKNSNEPLVCGRNNATVKIGGIPLNSHISCDICDDKNGCNGAKTTMSPSEWSQVALIMGLLLHYFVYFV